MKKALYILGDLEDADLMWLAGCSSVRQLGAGETLIRAGEPVTELYIVTGGALSVKSAAGDVISSLGAGDVIGEMSFVETTSPSVSVEAAKNARLLSIPRERLLAEFETNPAFSARFYRALAVFLSDRLRAMTATVAGEEVRTGLNDALLDNMQLAGDRVSRLIGLLEGKSAA